jgi:predicted secreted protein
MKTIFKLTLIYLTFMLTICTGSEFRLIKISETEEDNTYIPVKAGSKFILELAGNPTTGFNWVIENKDKLFSNKLITPINLDERDSAEYYKAPSDPNILGSGGFYHFKFLVSEDVSGDEVINFVHKRPWTDEDSVKKTINIKVVHSAHYTKDL